MLNGRSFFSNIPPVTKNLIIINFLFWLTTFILQGKFHFDLTKYLGLHYMTAPDFNAAQFITYMFMHDPNSIGHVFFNMFSVFIFGRTLETVWGPKRFLIYYMTTGIGAGLIQEFVWFLHVAGQTEIAVNTLSGVMDIPVSLYTSMFNTIGASGAVFGILLAFGMLFPNAELFIMFIPIPIKAKYFVAFYGLIELFFGVANVSGDNVAHFAHLGGMLFGFFLIRYWRKKGIGGSGRYF
ncbi:MAG: rhomboid family intramembrane serine protease [Bacteroidales bacterium]